MTKRSSYKVSFNLVSLYGFIAFLDLVIFSPTHFVSRNFFMTQEPHYMPHAMFVMPSLLTTFLNYNSLRPYSLVVHLFCVRIPYLYLR